MSRESDLSPLVAKIIAGHKWRFSPSGIPPANDSSFAEVRSTEQDILRRMPKPQPFRARGDLSEWVFRRAAAAVQGGREPQDPTLAEEITAQLKNPNSPFDFSVGLESESEEPYRAPLADDLVLEVETEHDDDTGWSTHSAQLRGKVSAYSREVALDESCRMIREAIGALVALGLASVYVDWWRDDELDFTLTGGMVLEGDPEPPRPPGELIDLVFKTHIEDYAGSQLDQARAVRTSAHSANRVVTQLGRLWHDKSEHAQGIRTACGLYARGEAATDPGVAVINYAMCLEGLLLERKHTENVGARLSEAVAYRLGKSPSERERLRESTRSLYKLRSEYVHTGSIHADLDQQEDLARTAGDALKREIEDF